jgi:glyoxylase-like metal-dependent hydrolase (beta-lactamase superfamily II)
MDKASFRLHIFRSAAFCAAIALGGIVQGISDVPARAAAPIVKSQAPGYYRVMLGDFEITALSDGTMNLDVAKLLKEPEEETKAALTNSFLRNPVETSVNAFLINTGTKLVLVDVGGGAFFGSSLNQLLPNLRAAGYTPEQIDDVLITHMHRDHVGGLSSRGALVFPNATVHADKRESDYWLSKDNLDKAPAELKARFQGVIESLGPYIAAGRYQPFQADTEILSGVRSVASYGHTVGHTMYTVESKEQKLWLIGDLIHVAAVQFDHPAVSFAFDSDGVEAFGSRNNVFAQAASEGVLVGAAHLQFPGLGHLQVAGNSWKWIPVNYTIGTP